MTKISMLHTITSIKGDGPCISHLLSKSTVLFSFLLSRLLVRVLGHYFLSTDTAPEDSVTHPARASSDWRLSSGVRRR